MSNLLDRINEPSDLKELSVAQLKELTEEIRQFILGSVSKTGGHLASNLGMVELTIALHYVFDFKKDKLLWDVGHQCYAHKIITGRKEQFSRLRKANGLSGFPNPAESDCDQFSVGHAGTSIATAIGMALGEQQQKRENKIVAIVGDASIVNGVNLEALNNLGLAKRQILIILNDNTMAIDPTQGAMAKYFAQVRLSHTYEDVRKTTANVLEHLPLIGKSVEDAIERIKKSIRMAISPSQVFEAMNIPYFGPVDGHDTSSLVKLFGTMSNLKSPAILHVYTKKGKGFSPADKDPTRFHSTGPFEINGNGIESGTESSARSFTKTFGENLVRLAEKDKKIVAITCAMSEGTGLVEFKKRFPDRFYDVGIAESSAVDVAAGLAKSGCKPVVCIYSTFLQRGFDQIFQEVALQNLGVVFCIDRAGFVGADGPTHHGLMDIGFLRMIPNMILAAPADEGEIALALEFALNSGKPVCLRYPKDTVDNLKLAACAEVFETGKSAFVKTNNNSTVALVSYGSMLGEVLNTAEILQAEGIDADVVNARFASPIDSRIIEMIGQGRGLVTVEDHRSACGFGSAVLEAAAKAYPQGIAKPIVVLGAGAEFVGPDSRKSQLMQQCINADKIAEAAKNMLSLAQK